jgi:hypothetical protein
MPIKVNYIPSVSPLIFVQNGHIADNGALVFNSGVNGYVLT